MLQLIILLLYCLAYTSVAVENELDGLKMVHLLYRHGDRTPCGGYPTDPYKDRSNWPVGPGQLTSVGKRMHFELGQWLRKRYDGFLSSNYSEEEIYVRSTDVDRTLMSAQANLAGLYPPSGYWVWNPDIPWQPIPVHTVPQQWDNLLSNHHTQCPRLNHMREQLWESQYMKSLYEDNKDLFDYISKHSGFDIKTVEKLDWVYDSLLIETLYNKTLPSWTQSVFPGGKFEELRNIVFLMDSFDHEMARLQAGPFLSEVVGHYDDSSSKKVYMYSAHDTTVSYVLNTLGIYDGLAPPYASAVLFELYSMATGPHVKISYRNDTSMPPYILTIPGCTQLCPLHTFKQLTHSTRPQHWDKECRLGAEEQDQEGAKKVQIGLLVLSLFMAALILLYTIWGMVARSSRGYESI